MWVIFTFLARNKLLAKSNWDTISWRVKLRLKPLVPVAQKEQAILHPTWEETHSEMP